MRMRKDDRGFSLVELIITMGIMAILAGVTVFAVGYINTGKTKKASTALDNQLDYIQTETMTKKGTAYLYLYKTADGIYTYVHTTDTTYPDGFTSRTQLDSNLPSGGGRKICDASVTGRVSTSGGDSYELSTGNMLKIGYDKSTGSIAYSNSGSVTETDFYNRISLEGKQHFQINMIKATGKHYIVES